MQATVLARCELICFLRKRNLRQWPATNQPDGQITKNLSSPSRKNIPLSIRPKSAVISLPSRLDKRGGSRVVTNAGRDAMDAGSVRREACSQGGYPVSGHGAQDDRCCGVRQNRVVLASVADVKLPVANLIQPDRSAIKPAAMEAKGIRLQGELGISRQTIAQGMPACSGCTCMLVCASHYILHTRPRVQQAPGIPCSLSFEGKGISANLGRNASRERGRASQ
jgi:hypothetical protein